MKTSPEKLAKIKAWRDANPEKVAAAQRRWRERHPEQDRAAKNAWAEANRQYPTAYYRKNNKKLVEQTQHRRKRNPEDYAAQVFRARAKRYGMTPEELQGLIDTQGNRCAICQARPTEARSLCVDHDHETGRVRGLLCARCNRDIDRLAPHLHRLIAYLG